MGTPYCLIVLGPTASGKSSLPFKVQTYLKLFNTGKYQPEKLLIDDLVVKNPIFKQGVDNFIKEKRDEKMSNNSIIEAFVNPDDTTFKYFSDIYYHTRTQVNCITGKKLTDKGETCFVKLDKDLARAIQNKKNIIIETTGTIYPDWIFERFKRVNVKYNIIMTWSIVNLCKLYQRNRNRARRHMKEYLTNNNKNIPPRLPDIRPLHFTSKLLKIQGTFLEALSKKNNVRLIIFNNNIKAITNTDAIYDSYKSTMTNKNGVKAILKYTTDFNYNCDSSLSFKKTYGSKKNNSKKNNSKKNKPKENKSNKPTFRKIISGSERVIHTGPKNGKFYFHNKKKIYIK
jgi:hypothetical protein